MAANSVWAAIHGNKNYGLYTPHDGPPRFDTSNDYNYQHDCKRWAHHIRCYGGIGDLPLLGKVPINDDLLVSRSHQHYGNGQFKRVPDVGKIDLSNQEKFALSENYPFSPYYSHRSIHEIFPTIDRNRVYPDGQPALSEFNQKALADLHDKVYRTTNLMHSDGIHDHCMRTDKDPYNKELFTEKYACPVRCQVPFLQQSFATLKGYINGRNLDAVQTLLWQLKNTHTCDHKNNLCTTTGNAFAQPYCMICAMVQTIQSPDMDSDAKLNVLSNQAECASAGRAIYGNSDAWKKPPEWPPATMYQNEYEPMRLMGQYGKKERSTNYANIIPTLELKLNESHLKDLQDDPPAIPPHIPPPRSSSAPSEIEWPRRRCAVKDYAQQVDVSVPPTLYSMLKPTGPRIQDRLGLSYKTDAHNRYHALYPDPVPDPREPHRTPKKSTFWGYNSSVFRGNTVVN